MIAKQRVTRQHHSRRAVAALESAMFYKVFLYGTQLSVFRQSFDGRDFTAVLLDGKVQTRLHELVVEQNRAGAAYADDAADVGSGETDVLAEKMGQQETRLDVLFILSAVDGDGYSRLHTVE